MVGVEMMWLVPFVLADVGTGIGLIEQNIRQENLDSLLSPLRGSSVFHSPPTASPWAAIFRRFAAGSCRRIFAALRLDVSRLVKFNPGGCG